ncbi:MAG: glutamate--tRNA ligase [Desulfobacterales bacterium]|nr:glutamate--tRNA ligase [Desulfobacterales bacterium]
MDPVITRFPPSPTGWLHVGGARTALFNWLYARHTGGRFVLRFEDTDIERSTPQSVDAILESMAWLGIDWDEGPYFQSERLPVYREHLQILLDTGHAYYCTCSPEDIEAMRREATAHGGKPRYDGRCRNKQRPASDDAVIRFKAPATGTTVVDDRVKGPIAFQNSELDDFIICRSDGMPMYNLAVVVDDITMGINTIIRGDDHVNNTPKQILLYKALGVPLPLFAHVPMVLGNDRSRLSKRHGAMSVTEYREMGYLPDAMLNYLVRLGWSHGDQEFFTRPELIAKFSLDNIGKSAGVFDPAKLLALNAEHIREAKPETLVGPLQPFLKAHEVTQLDRRPMDLVIATLQPRSKTLVEMAAGALFYFQSPIVYEDKAAAKFLKPSAQEPLRQLTTALTQLSRFDEAQIEGAFAQTMEATGLKLGKIAQPVRVALSGKTVSPGIFEMIRVLGREETLVRINQALAFIEARAAAPP